MVKQNNKSHSTTVHEVIKEIRKEILNGTLKEGERLIQDEWAQRLNVSRMPIREALTHLEMEGLVEIKPHKGAIVTPITQEDIEEIFNLRCMLEATVVEKSLPYLTEEDVTLLGEVLIEMETLKLTDETNDKYSKLNAKFHAILHKDCPWPRAKKFVDNLGISPIAPKLLEPYYEKTQQDHRRIYEAVLRRDPQELRLAMEYHLTRTKNNLLKVIQQMNDEKNKNESI
ncbi:GntR family transcriptional regulator [Pseudogracilibacillus sp. SE30717A]|uniref:GntR family transcriptional regulator n=1 Tax=Pseudogracilibacillus sp. SE30717A TaxID=3098293 RepID=UPI00300E5E33